MKITSIILILTLGILELVHSREAIFDKIIEVLANFANFLCYFLEIQSCQNVVTKKDGSCVNIEACKNIFAVRNDARYAPYIQRIKCKTHLQTVISK